MDKDSPLLAISHYLFFTFKEELNMKLKTTLLYVVTIIMVLFTILWFTDTLLPTYNPDYSPLLNFLKITQVLLNILIEV